jgi:hypothetical protein
VKRKLLDGSLIVFLSAALFKAAVALWPYGIHLRREMRDGGTALLIMSGSLAVSLAAFMLFERLIPRLRKMNRRILTLDLVILLFVVLATVSVAYFAFSPRVAQQSSPLSDFDSPATAK